MSKLLKKFKNEIIVFSVLAFSAVVEILLKGYSVGFVTYWLPDFSLGYCTRFLAGEILSLFDKNPTFAEMKILWSVILFLTLILLSALIGRFLSSVPENLKRGAWLFVFFLLTGMLSLNILSSCVGLLDIFWVIAAAVGVFFLHNRALKYLIPVICVAAVFVHPVFVLSMFPMLSGIMLFKCLGDKRERGDIFVLSGSIITTGAAFIYSVLFETKTLTVGARELNEYIAAKTDVGIIEDYFSYYLFMQGNLPSAPESVGGPPALDMARGMFRDIVQMLEGRLQQHILIPLLALPVFACIFYVFLCAFKSEKKKAMKLWLVLAMLAPLSAVAALFLSTDAGRFISYGLIAQFGLLFYPVFSGSESVCGAFGRVSDFLIKHYECTAVFAVFWMTVYFAWL